MFNKVISISPIIASFLSIDFTEGINGRRLGSKFLQLVTSYGCTNTAPCPEHPIAENKTNKSNIILETIDLENMDLKS